jgi:hypothetical protein
MLLSFKERELPKDIALEINAQFDKVSRSILINQINDLLHKPTDDWATLPGQYYNEFLENILLTNWRGDPCIEKRERKSIDEIALLLSDVPVKANGPAHELFLFALFRIESLISKSTLTIEDAEKILAELKLSSETGGIRQPLLLSSFTLSGELKEKFFRTISRLHSPGGDLRRFLFMLSILDDMTAESPWVATATYLGSMKEYPEKVDIAKMEPDLANIIKGKGILALRRIISEGPPPDLGIIDHERGINYRHPRFFEIQDRAIKILGESDPTPSWEDALIQAHAELTAAENH